MDPERKEECSGKREFTYIQPRQGKRATEYEELTLYERPGYEIKNPLRAAQTRQCS